MESKSQYRRDQTPFQTVICHRAVQRVSRVIILYEMNWNELKVKSKIVVLAVVPPKCRPSVASVPSQCRPSAASVPSECRLSAARVPPQCRLGAAWVPSEISSMTKLSVGKGNELHWRALLITITGILLITPYLEYLLHHNGTMNYIIYSWVLFLKIHTYFNLPDSLSSLVKC